MIYYDYPGVIHLHSFYSDGSSSPQEVVKGAQEAGCTYLILTDHDSLAATDYQGWHDGTLLLVGEEVTVGQNDGHYLAFNLIKEIQPYQPPQKVINQVRIQNGIGFIAHPYDRMVELIFFDFTPETWRDWNVQGFTGLEVWNYTQDWIDDLEIRGPLSETLTKWSELTQTAQVVGIGSVDAHGWLYPYQKIFRTLRTHILLGEPLSFNNQSLAKDQYLVYQALKKGHCYFSLDSLEKPNGFRFSARGYNQEVSMGDKMAFRKEIQLEAALPRAAIIRILKDGELVAEVRGRHLAKEIEERGAYRLEAYLEGKFKAQPWIYSNPIYIT